MDYAEIRKLKKSIDLVSTEGVVINNRELYLLECDKGYILENDRCIPHCYSTCLRCKDYSTNKNDQK